MIYSWPQLKKIEFYKGLNKSYNLLINATFYERFILSMPIFTTYLKLHPLKKSKSFVKLWNITSIEKKSEIE